MSAAFPLACYRDSILEVATSVFGTLLGLPIHSGSNPAASFRGAFTAAVHYAGSWKGALVLECSAAQAESWAARLLPIPPPLAVEDVRDALGELANVIAGNLKPLLPPGVGLSMPSVVQGADYRFGVIGSTLREQISFADSTGEFRIALVEVVSGA